MLYFDLPVQTGSKTLADQIVIYNRSDVLDFILDLDEAVSELSFTIELRDRLNAIIEVEQER